MGMSPERPGAAAPGRKVKSGVSRRQMRRVCETKHSTYLRYVYHLRGAHQRQCEYVAGPENRVTDILMFNSRNLGALIVAEEPHVKSWEDGQYNIQNMSIEETWPRGILQEGQAVAVAKNVKIRPNEFVCPISCSAPLFTPPLSLHPARLPALHSAAGLGLQHGITARSGAAFTRLED